MKITCLFLDVDCNVIGLSASSKSVKQENISEGMYFKLDSCQPVTAVTFRDAKSYSIHFDVTN